jgi:hypothetical protein
MTDNEKEVERLIAEAAIVRQLYRYCHALDANRHKDLIELFAADCVLDMRYCNRKKALSQRLTGRRALAKWATGYKKRFPVQQRHQLSVPIVTVRGSSATAVSYFATIYEYNDGPRVAASGRYRDRLVQEKGRSIIKTRIVDVAV